MSIRQLRTLIAIADLNSFSAAANRLCMTQSAVSMQMKALEQELRIKLFDRTRRVPVLNSNGLRMVDEARRVIESYDSLPSVATTRHNGLTGSLRLGVVPSVATHLLPRVLSTLRENHPALRIQVRCGLSPELAFKIEQHQLDAAILTLPERLEQSSSFELLAEEELKIVVHRALARGSVKEMLTAHPFIRFNPAMGIGRLIDGALRTRRIAVNDCMEFDSIETMVELVRLKLGVTIIPMGVVWPNLRAPFKTISFEPPVKRAIGVLAHRSSFNEPTVRAVSAAFRATKTKST